MEQMFTFSNAVLVIIFVTILVLFIGYSIYTLRNDKGDDDLGSFHQEPSKKESSEIWKPRPTAIRRHGESESRIGSLYLPQEAIERNTGCLHLDDTEYRLRRLQLLNAESPSSSATSFQSVVDDPRSIHQSPESGNDSRPSSSD